MKILKAQLEHLNDIAPLFDGYRVFYRQLSNLETAKAFIKERIEKQESIIYIAYIDNTAVGFTQLYPLFSSVSMKRMELLNDLYIHPDYRNRGIGKALIGKAKLFCKNNNSKGLAIQTEITNRAQHLYERLGFIKDPDLHFFWTNNE
ncbi:GNAT family N-acetyltransferase [Flavobacteriaceae bacterium AU392]|nr:N-acetyltransferase [Flavobacteriaceae bacterium]RKM86131.1 GNAT family N-acetyltransferase [Flavobacteriaceae bacterium AU392]